MPDFIAEIHATNFSSFKNIDFIPENLSVIIGNNNTGKSNFLELIDFIAYMYKWGLSEAIEVHGGFEAIVHKSPDGKSSESISIMIGMNLGQNTYRVEHFLSFSLRYLSKNITVNIDDESLRIYTPSDMSNSLQIDALIRRSHSKIKFERDFPKELLIKENTDIPFCSRLRMLSHIIHRRCVIKGDKCQVLPKILSLGLVFPDFTKISELRTYNYNTVQYIDRNAALPKVESKCRSNTIANLLNFFKVSRPKIYGHLLNLMREVDPNFDRLEIVLSINWRHKVLIYEKNRTIPLTLDDLSDGTLRMLVLLVSIYDNRKPLIVIDNPEHHLHPWAIRIFMNECRHRTHSKQFVMITHSPVIMDMLEPKEVWITTQIDGTGKLENLAVTDPSIQQKWECGDIKLWSYLDSLQPEKTWLSGSEDTTSELEDSENAEDFSESEGVDDYEDED